MFQVLEDTANSPTKFPHIHGGETGIRTITVDMCRKQAPGMFPLYIIVTATPLDPWAMRPIDVLPSHDPLYI
jgi:hypothetical protein